MVENEPSARQDAQDMHNDILDYQALFDKLQDSHLRVVDIDKRLEGHNKTRFRTRSYLIDRQLQQVYDARTLEEVHSALVQAERNLADLNVFREVNIVVHEDPEDDPEACSVVMQLVEKPWYRARAASFVQGGEVSMETSLGMDNFRGCAERVLLHVELGTASSKQHRFTYEQPLNLPGSGMLKGEVSASHTHRNHQRVSSFTETLTGVAVALRSMDNAQSLQYDLGWRQIADPTRRASRAVLQQSGDFLRSALSYVCLVDRRDAVHAQRRGWALRSLVEVSGLWAGSDLRHVKHQVDYVAALPITSAITARLSASAGLLLPWALPGQPYRLNQPTCIADRFFIGGYPTVRGFKYQALGPSEERRPVTAAENTEALKRDALGGDLFSSLYAGVTCALPHPALRAVGLQGHAWVNGGNLVQLAGISRAPRQSLAEFGSTWRWSSGVGLTFNTPLGPFEANYVWVLTSQVTDRVKKGVQFGFAASSIP